jgi:acyl-CoA synthetase (AMP-forming)/AMP-acid ligase II
MQTESAAGATFRSPHPDVEVPAVTVTEFALRRAGELADRPALIDAPSGRTLTYGALAAGVERVAAGLAARGFGRGDVLAINAPNLPEWPLPVLGALAAGGTVTTANPLYTARELAAQLEDSRARLLVTIAPFAPVALEAAAAAGVEDVVAIGDAPDGTTPLAALMRAAGPPAAPDTGVDETALLLYSSGTTGTAKGVALTHRQWVTNIVQTEAVCPAGPGEAVLAVAPFFHALGITTLLGRTLAYGGTIVSLPRFEIEPFLAAIQEHRVTQTIVVPPVLLALAKHPAVDDYDLSSLQWIGCGAAPLGAEVEQAVADRLGCVVAQGYGMTEASACIAITTFQRPEAIVRGSCGPLLPNTEGRIVDGELWIRGPQVMSGYLGRPEATAATVDEDGWLHTGDVARVDDAGNVFIVDRLKELIKYKAFQVAPAELEALLVTHPQVLDTAVVRGEDAEAGEIPVAYVVREGDLGGEELMTWVSERVAPHKRVRRVEFIDAIPKSPSGKILRRVLVERERSIRSG